MTKHIVFDAYGTLFDLSTSLNAAKEQLGSEADNVLAHWRILQLEYAWLSALSKQYIDFEVATRNAFKDALSTVSISDDKLINQLVESFKTVSAYDDAKKTLKALKAAGHKTLILSNGSKSILSSAVRSSGLSAHLDKVLSVDTVQTYKPAPEAYNIALDEFGITKKDVIFISSNWWDVDGAGKFGYKTVWIDRSTYDWPPSIEKPEDIVSSLGELNSLIS